MGEGTGVVQVRHSPTPVTQGGGRYRCSTGTSFTNPCHHRVGEGTGVVQVRHSPTPVTTGWGEGTGVVQVRHSPTPVTTGWGKVQV